MTRFSKVFIAAVVTAGFMAPALVSAQTKSDPATETTAADTSSSSSDSADFEKTRQHMIEMNKESQRTGKM